MMTVHNLESLYFSLSAFWFVVFFIDRVVNLKDWTDDKEFKFRYNLYRIFILASFWVGGCVLSSLMG